LIDLFILILTIYPSYWQSTNQYDKYTIMCCRYAFLPDVNLIEFHLTLGLIWINSCRIRLWFLL